MLSLFWKLFLTMWLSIVGFSATIGWLNDKLAREQWAEEPGQYFFPWNVQDKPTRRERH